jgi:hypothetical protein
VRDHGMAHLSGGAVLELELGEAQPRGHLPRAP